MVKEVAEKKQEGFIEHNAFTSNGFDAESFVKSKVAEVCKNGIVLVRGIEPVTQHSIHTEAKNIPNIVSFSIGSENERIIVLRTKRCPEEEYINHVSVSNEGRMAYKAGNYDLCIEKYRQLLKIGTPNSLVYATLGLSYLKKAKRKLAIDYLTVANELAKEKKLNYDYTDLIAQLKTPFSDGERKPIVKMRINEFCNDLSYNYGVKNVEDVIKLVRSGMNLSEACQCLGLETEQKCIVALIFAKNYYAERNYIVGDRYLKLAEKMKSTSKFTLSLWDEVRKNKKFYANRVNEKEKAFVLSQRKEYKV